jgi:hypothetical protein
LSLIHGTSITDQAAAANVGPEHRLPPNATTIRKTMQCDKIHTHFGGDLDERTFALWGLSFKPDTDDIRKAPSRTLMEALWAVGARVPGLRSEGHKGLPEANGDRPDLFLAQSQEAAGGSRCRCTGDLVDESPVARRGGDSREIEPAGHF